MAYIYVMRFDDNNLDGDTTQVAFTIPDEMALITFTEQYTNVINDVNAKSDEFEAKRKVIWADAGLLPDREAIKAAQSKMIVQCAEYPVRSVTYEQAIIAAGGTLWEFPILEANDRKELVSVMSMGYID